MFQSKKIIRSFYFGLFLGLALIIFFLVQELSPKPLKFYVFDVGQGDAIFIRTPQGFNILIDGGPDNAVIYKLGEYLPFYDRQVDLMILTHPHTDHLVGLIEVLKRYRVKKVLTSGVSYDSTEYAIWQSLITNQAINIEIVFKPKIYRTPDGLQLEVLAPDKNLSNQTIKNINNASLVLVLSYQTKRVLLMGDFEQEEMLVCQNLNLKADILKLGHHGSLTANNLSFLKVANPEIAVISVGAGNKFKQPTQATLVDLVNLGVNIFRTDLNGDFSYFIASP